MSEEKPSSDTQTDDSSAKDELIEAIDHLRTAANILFDRAAKDPTLDRAHNEADRIVSRISESAEPLAKQLTGELAKWSKKLAEAVEEKRSGNDE
ncbi:MAG: hypothetical protein AAGF12_35345 [Myxococcota bacterium]